MQKKTFKGRDICVLSGPRTDEAVQTLTDPANDLRHARLPCSAPGQWAVQLQECHEENLHLPYAGVGPNQLDHVWFTGLRDVFWLHLPCPKGRFKPLYWTLKYLSDRKMVTSSFELEKILDYKKNARKKWYCLCRWKGFGPEEDKWEPASSFIHGYTDTFIKFLKKHPEINRELSLIKDCVTKEDLQAQEEAPIVAESIRDKI